MLFQKLFQILAAVSVLIVLSNCKILQQDSKPHIPVSEIRLEMLEAVDLSENYKTLSSKKDEIVLFAYYLKGDSLLIESWSSNFLSFTETAKQNMLKTSFMISDLENSKLVFILMEMDTKRVADDLDRIFQSNFRLLNGIQADQSTLQLLLGDDDLLDLKVINLKKLSAQDNNKLKFSGVHLFDEYEYTLHCKYARSF